MQALPASIQIPVSPKTAFRVISDLPTLLRLSPFFTLTRFESPNTGPLRLGIRSLVTLEYYATRRIEAHSMSVDAFEPDRTVSYAIGEGVLKGIRYDIDRTEGGIMLTQTLTLDAADEAVLAGSQKELQLWMRSVGEYMMLAEGGSILRRILLGFMDRIWLRMTLSERAIAIMITKISILELALLLVLVLAWRLFVR